MAAVAPNASENEAGVRPHTIAPCPPPIYEVKLHRYSLTALVASGVGYASILGCVLTVAVRSVPSIWGLPELLIWLASAVLLTIAGIKVRRLPGRQHHLRSAALVKVQSFCCRTQLLAICGLAVTVMCALLPFYAWPWGVRKDEGTGLYKDVKTGRVLPNQDTAEVHRAKADLEFAMLTMYAFGPLSCVFYIVEVVICSCLVSWCRTAEAAAATDTDEREHQQVSVVVEAKL